MSHPQIFEFTHTKPSRAGEALNLIPSLPVPIEDEETQYTRDPYGKRLGHPLAKFPERRRGNESSMSLRSADVSGAGSALRHFLLDGAPKLRIDVAEESLGPHAARRPQEHRGKSLMAHGAWQPQTRDTYSAPRVSLRVEAGMRLTVRIRTLQRTRVLCTSDYEWRDQNGAPCAGYTSDLGTFAAGLAPGTPKQMVKAWCNITNESSAPPGMQMLNAIDVWPEMVADARIAALRCCECGGGTRVHPVREEEVVVAEVSSTDEGPCTPENLVEWLHRASRAALAPHDAWLAFNLQDPVRNAHTDHTRETRPTIAVFGGRGEWGRRYPLANISGLLPAPVRADATHAGLLHEVIGQEGEEGKVFEFTDEYLGVFPGRVEEVISVEVVANLSSLLPVMGITATKGTPADSPTSAHLPTCTRLASTWQTFNRCWHARLAAAQMMMTDLTVHLPQTCPFS